MFPIELKSSRFTIRPYCRTDEDRFIEMVMDGVSTEFMGGATGVESEEREVFRKIFQIYDETIGKPFWIWGIYNGDALFGHLELKETEHTNEDELEIVSMVHPECRRIGVMTEILSLIKMNEMIWNKRIVATVSADNAVSLRMLEKWGIDSREIIIDEETDEEFLKLLLAR